MKKVLVVDDNEANIRLVRFILEKHGCQVYEARNGADGVASAIQKKPDLILMDVQLPDIDGLEATKRIRASEADGDIPIIALTSYAMPGDKEKCLAAGCTGYIAKPINVDTFIAEIEEILANTPVQQSIRGIK